MTFHIVTVDDDFRLWDDYVEQHPLATGYHRFGWKEVIERSFSHDACYLAVQDGDGNLHGVLPLIRMSSVLFGRFMVSLPFVNYGGLLCSCREAEAMLVAEAAKVSAAMGAGYVELRHVGDRNIGLPVKTHKVTMILELERDVDSQWKAFNAKLRNQVRKAENSGFTVMVGSLELLDGFYEVFCRNMRDLGTPVYAKTFFRNVLSAFPDSTRIVSVLHGGRPVAAGLVCWFRDTLEMPWASSKRDYKTLCPNNLLYWEAIRFAIGHGFTRFDFGRSTPGEGTYKFKAQWGARPVALHWHYLMRDNAPLPELSPKNARYGLAIKVWQRLPVAVTKIIGPLVVRNIP